MERPWWKKSVNLNEMGFGFINVGFVDFRLVGLGVGDFRLVDLGVRVGFSDLSFRVLGMEVLVL